MRYTQRLSAATIFVSAFLLFAVEPLIAKKLLPWFGGSAAVWSTCLVFFQTTLLAGYVYTRLLTRWLTPRRQAVVHVLLVALSLTALPLGPSVLWTPAASASPTWPLLLILATSIGLPFLTLSATSPLLQHWLASAGYEAPQRLFALSNLASLAALLAYPTLIEPAFDVRTQSWAWSAGYVAFVLLCGAAAFLYGQFKPGLPAKKEPFEYINVERRLTWFALAACGSMLLLSVTNHITENVAAVPFLWVLPLAVYLLTFILSFEFFNFYKRAVFLRILAMGLGLVAYAIYDIHAIEIIQVSLPIFLFGLFAGCMFCHGELNRLRPAAGQLTTFYVMLSFGGAAGAIFVGLVAPAIFDAVYELPIALTFTGVLALLLTWREGWALRMLWSAIGIAMFLVLAANVDAYRHESLSMRRSFYGALRVVQTPRAGPQQMRTLFHGTITHGAQFVQLPKRLRPTTYYGPESGIGILLRDCYPSPKRVGIVGLGAGTIAAYGQAGDTFRFYEINSQVVDIAQSLFTYLRESHAQVQIVEGDARLSLEKDTVEAFDVLAVDAFSGDAIPVHLLTAEAMRLYFRHLRPAGTVAIHVSNQYLELAPVVQQLAATVGARAVLIENHGDDEDDIKPSDWVLVTRNEAVLNNESVDSGSKPIALQHGLRLWTDNYNNLFDVLKKPRFLTR